MNVFLQKNSKTVTWCLYPFTAYLKPQHSESETVLAEAMCGWIWLYRVLCVLHGCSLLLPSDNHDGASQNSTEWTPWREQEKRQVGLQRRRQLSPRVEDCPYPPHHCSKTSTHSKLDYAGQHGVFRMAVWSFQTEQYTNPKRFLSILRGMSAWR